jgi:hypothetical protein
MKLKFEMRKRPLAIILGLVAAASVVAGREKPALEVVPAEPAAAATAPLALDLGKLRRADAGAPQSDPFAPRSFAAPRERGERAALPQAPSAPPLPFSYFGRLTENGSTEVFVMRGDELISIAAGRNIDAEYRVEAITPSAIRFTYLPLKTRQTLELDEARG